MTEMFRWEDPPKSANGRFKKSMSMAAKLGRKKGSWACIGEYDKMHSASARGVRIRKGQNKSFKNVGKFEVKNVRKGDKWYLYVRCVAWTKGFAEGINPGSPEWTTEHFDLVEDNE